MSGVGWLGETDGGGRRRSVEPVGAMNERDVSTARHTTTTTATAATTTAAVDDTVTTATATTPASSGHIDGCWGRSQ